MTELRTAENKKAQVLQHLGFVIRFISHVTSMS